MKQRAGDVRTVDDTVCAGINNIALCEYFCSLFFKFRIAGYAQELYFFSKINRCCRHSWPWLSWNTILRLFCEVFRANFLLKSNNASFIKWSKNLAHCFTHCSYWKKSIKFLDNANKESEVTLVRPVHLSMQQPVTELKSRGCYLFSNDPQHNRPKCKNYPEHLHCKTCSYLFLPQVLTIRVMRKSISRKSFSQKNST